MLDILKFIFSSFWIWCGTFFILVAALSVIAGGINGFIRITYNNHAKPEKSKD